MVGDLCSGLCHYLVHIFLNELIELAIAVNRLLDRSHLVTRDVARDLFPALAILVVVKSAARAFANDREGPTL
jgi:hypothetical protein